MENFDRENVDELLEIRQIHQYFPHKNFVPYGSRLLLWSNYFRNTVYAIFKPGAGWCMPGFLKLLWFAHWYVCVCVSTPKSINNQWHDVV